MEPEQNEKKEKSGRVKNTIVSLLYGTLSLSGVIGAYVCGHSAGEFYRFSEELANPEVARVARGIATMGLGGVIFSAYEAANFSEKAYNTIRGRN